MPLSCSNRTWSCMSAISGEITMQTPGRSRVGSWKHSDLPPPVGMMASTSRPRRMSLTISCWPGRKVSKPKRCLSAAARAVGETSGGERVILRGIISRARTVASAKLIGSEGFSTFRSAPVEKLVEGCGELTRAFDVAQVRGVEQREFCAGNRAHDVTGVGRGGAPIFRAADDERVGADRANRFTLVHVADGRATGGE